MYEMESIFAVMDGVGVRRFHTHRTLHQQTVGEHGASVCLLLYLMTRGACRKELFVAALLDDLAEYYTGDIPSPFKRSVPGLRDRVHDVGDIWLADRGLVPPQLTEQERGLLKLADSMDGLLFCAREVEIGNRKMLAVGDTFLGYVSELLQGNLSEHRHFAENVIRIWNRAARTPAPKNGS